MVYLSRLILTLAGCLPQQPRVLPFLQLRHFFFASKMLKTTGQYLLHIVSLIAFIAIVGYIFNIPALYKLSFLSSMAVHTSLALFCFSVAVSLVNPYIGITGLFSRDKIATGWREGCSRKRSLQYLRLGFFSCWRAYRFVFWG